MENMVSIKYYCCENRFIVRVIKDHTNNLESLEFYDPITAGWIPNQNWYIDMFINKNMSFKEISLEESKSYINNSIQYRKKDEIDNIYLRLIYGLDLEVLNDKTGKWEDIDDDEWYQEFNNYKVVSEEDVKQHIKSLFVKKTR